MTTNFQSKHFTRIGHNGSEIAEGRPDFGGTTKAKGWTEAKRTGGFPAISMLAAVRAIQQSSSFIFRAVGTP